jgi:hypothetical protein
MLVYKVTNLFNKKVYIGQTIHTLEQRRKSHYSKANREQKYSYFLYALKKQLNFPFSLHTLSRRLSEDKNAS